MRNIARVAGVSAAVVAAMGMGAPAFAGPQDGDDIDQKFSYELDKDWSVEVSSDAEGDGGDGGEATNFLSCLINIPVLSPGNDQACLTSADGGDGGTSAAGIEEEN